MQSNATPVVTSTEQQPKLPTYAEATGAAAPPTMNPPSLYTVDQHMFYPTGPAYGPQSVPVHVQNVHGNYSHVPMSTNGFTYPPTYTTNAYPQYGRTVTDLEVPTTIHIIRPEPPESTCCGSTGGRLLGVFIAIALFSAILRSMMTSRY